MARSYSIGAFSKRVQISVKALRFYETAGLLHPARVDPGTGYRYFTDDQVPLANTIVTLRATGMPIAEIASALVASPEAYDDALRRQYGALLDERDRLERRIAIAEALLGRARPPASYRLVTVDPALVVSERIEPGSKRTVSSSFEALERIVAQRDARADAPPYCEISDEDAWTVCVPVIDAAADALQAGVSGKPGIACSLTYVGAYHRSPEELGKMRSWIEAAGLRRNGPSREIYHRFGADQEGYALPAHVIAPRPELYVTELQIPVELQKGRTA